jgi:hypothetical protein
MLYRVPTEVMEVWKCLGEMNKAFQKSGKKDISIARSGTVLDK